MKNKVTSLYRLYQREAEPRAGCGFSISRLSCLVLPISVLVCPPVYAQTDSVAVCESSASDVDGDGWGWENGASCIVSAGGASDGFVACNTTDSDPDGDGWGWENNNSCVVSEDSSSGNSGDTPLCESAASDADGDGWGWENSQTCMVQVTQNDPSTPAVTDVPACEIDTSDPDGDGWGWENDASCVVGSGDSTGGGTGDDGASTSTAGVVCDYVDSTYNDSASVMATSNSEWTCSETQRVLTANGIPDHDVGVFPNAGNPNTIGAVDVSVNFTLTPVSAGTITALGGPAGPQGYVLNGVKIDAATAGSCDNSGVDCSLVDNTGAWNIEALGQEYFDFGDDQNNAHVQPDGSYHYHGMPEGFITRQGGNSSTMTLIGWASDGFPIYARYGYSVASDAGSALVNMTASYQLVGSVSDSRPSTNTYALGTFAQDWQYVEGSGDLDACNGRFGVTPEFPGGIYHYYATDSYPYFQRCVTGVVEGGAGGGGPRPDGDRPPGGLPPQ